MQNVPAFVAGLVLALYWGRVLSMAWRAKRRTGRAAGLVPEERTGRTLRLLWFPVVGLWIASPLVLGLSARPPRVFAALVDWPVVAWVGAGVAVLSLALTAVCWRTMGKSWRMGIDPGSTTRLVTEGPYAYVRHPINALSTLLALASFVASPSIALAVVVPLHIALLQWEARREERFLLSRHGDAYARYAAATGRFLPRSFRPYAPSGS